jgi:hypothetical protein
MRVSNRKRERKGEEDGPVFSFPLEFAFSLRDSVALRGDLLEQQLAHLT